MLAERETRTVPAGCACCPRPVADLRGPSGSHPPPRDERTSAGFRAPCSHADSPGMTDQFPHARGTAAEGSRHGRRAAALAIAAATAVLTASVPGVAAAAPAAPYTLGGWPARGYVPATTGLQQLAGEVSAMGADLYPASALPA